MCLEVWIEINHSVPIEIAWWIQQHMCCYRKLWVCVLYMRTVTFSISYVLLNRNTKIHLILLNIRSGVVYIFIQYGTSIFTGKTCTVITTKDEIVKLVKYCLRSLWGVCKNCVSRAEGIPASVRCGSPRARLAHSQRVPRAAPGAELSCVEQALGCWERVIILQPLMSFILDLSLQCRFHLWLPGHETQLSPVWIYSPYNYQVSCHLSLYHGYSAYQKNLVINIPQDAWEAVMSPLHRPG